MAAPQQHTLTNTTSTLAASPAVLAATSLNNNSSASADTYESGHPASCGEVYGRLSGVGVGGLNPPATATAHFPSPRPASRRLRPCSLCGTTALRPHPTLLPTSPLGPLEQPVVLLHRLEDGLPQGDVNSLRAYGTIRLLPVHSPTHNAASEDDRSDQDGDSNEGQVNHAMALTRHADDAGRHENTSRSGHYTNWTCNNGGDDKHTLGVVNSDHHGVGEVLISTRLMRTEFPNAGALKGGVNVIENESEADSDEPFIGIRIQSVVSGRDLDTEGIHLPEGDVGDSGRNSATPETTSLSLQCHASSTTSAPSTLSRRPSHSSPCSTDYHPPSPPPPPPPPPPPLPTTPPPSNPTAVSTTSSCYSSPTSPSTSLLASATTHTIPSTPEHSQTTNHHNRATTYHSSLTTGHHRPSTPSSPYTPMSMVISSPLQPLSSYSPTAPLASPHSQSHPPGSPPFPPTFSPPDSPPSPPSSTLSSPSPTCPPGSVDAHILPPSSPYSPMTLPSSPTSPASLPSRAESPPSPTQSTESPPASPVPSQGLSCHEVQHASPHMHAELAEISPPEERGFPNSQDEPWEKLQTERCQAEPSADAEDEPVGDTVVQTSVGANIDPPMDTQDELPVDSQTNPSGATQVEPLEDIQTGTVLSEGETQVESCESTQVESLSELDQGEDEELALESQQGVSSYCERVSDESDPSKGPVKIKFRLRHKVESHPPLGSEKKECNKENGIPKIVLTLKGNGPNKEYSCSNRLRSEDQSFSGVTVNNKKHKSKKDKKQKLRDKERIKKALKGNKHKRHLELFGEDSNDSCDISNKCNGLTGQVEDLREATGEEQKNLHLPVAFPTLGESPERSDDELPPSPTQRESYAFSIKVERVCEKIKYSSTSESLDDSLSDSLPDLEPLPPPEDAEGLAVGDKKTPMKEEDTKKVTYEVVEEPTESTPQHGSLPPAAVPSERDVLSTATSDKPSHEDKKTTPINRDNSHNQEKSQKITGHQGTEKSHSQLNPHEISTNELGPEKIPEISISHFCPDEAISQPNLEKITGKSTSQPVPEKFTGKSTGEPSPEKNTGKSSNHPCPEETENTIIQSGPEKIAGKSTSQPGPEKITGKSTSQGGPEKITGKSTSQPGPENITGKSTSQPGPEKIAGKSISEPSPEKVTGKSTSQPGPEKITGKSTSQPGPEKITGKSISEPSPEKITRKSTSQPGPENITGKSSKSTSQPGPEKITGKSTSQLGPEKIAGKSTSHLGCDPSENTRGSTLRSRRERHVKKSESDRDSDRCLWVSFGVDGPVPLPTSDMPSLEPILESGDNNDTFKTGDSDHDSDSSHTADKPIRDVEKPRRDRNSLVTASRKQSQGGKSAEAKSEKSLNAVVRFSEEKAELLVKEYNERHKRSSSSVSQSSDREVKDTAHGRKHMKVEQAYWRSSAHKPDKARLSKRSYRSSGSRQARERKEVVETSSSEATPTEIIVKGDDASRELSANTSVSGASKNQKAKSFVSEDLDVDEAAREEKSSNEELTLEECKTSSVIVSLSSDESPGSQTNEEHPGNSEISQKPLELTDKLESSEIVDDSQYYRPKKIRRMSDTKLSKDASSDKRLSRDISSEKKLTRDTSSDTKLTRDTSSDTKLTRDTSSDTKLTRDTSSDIRLYRDTLGDKETSRVTSNDKKLSSDILHDAKLPGNLSSDSKLPNDASSDNTLSKDTSSDLLLSSDTSVEKHSSIDPQDPRKSWSVISQTEKYPSQERNLSENKNQVCAKSTTAHDATAEAPSGATVMHGSCAGSSASKVFSDASDVETDTREKVSEVAVERDNQPNPSISAPQDPGNEKGQKRRKSRPRTFGKQNSKVGSQDDCGDRSSPHSVDEKEEGTTDKLISVSREDSLSSKEDIQKQETSHKDEKEKKRKTRRERKKNSSAGSRSWALQEAQQRQEVQHEEERGRRLAQEIKGFNWLEQKIKNGSLLSSGSSVPSTPTTPTKDPPGLVSKTSSTSSLSSDPPTPSSAPPFPFTSRKREEEESRRNSLSGISGGTGLRRHLQTAVPPLAPSSRVTALPKRRLSPTHVPPVTISASAALYNPTSVHNMTVQGTVNTAVPALYGSTNGKTGTVFGKPSAASDPSDSNKATLYSSTTCNKATLYGVNSENLEVFIDSVSTASNYYGSVTNNITTVSDDAITSPSNYYGSETLPSVQHPAMPSSSGVSSHPSVITSSASDWAQHTVGHFGPPYFNNPVSSPHVSADQGVGRQSCSNNINSQSVNSTVSSAPKQFSHKHTLLRRAFREMLKSDSESSPEPVQKDKIVFEYEEAPDLPKTHEGVSLQEASVGSTHVPTPSTGKSLPLGDESLRSLKSIPKDDISESMTSHVEVKTLTPREEGSTGIDESTEKKTVDYPKNEFQDSKTKEMQMIQEVPEAVQNRVLESITEGGGKFDVKSLKGDTKSEFDIQGREEDREMQSSLLLSVLYKELMRTRQEVEELRKVQEQMRTEKREKKEDSTEENKMEESIVSNDKKGEKRRCSSDSNYDPVLDNKELSSQPDAKKSKISIRSDLMTTNTSCTTAPITATSEDTVLPRNSPLLASSSPSPSTLRTNTQIITTSKVPLTSPVLPEQSSELSVIGVVNSSAPQTSHILSGTSPTLSRTSPTLSQTSPGVSRTSPVLPRTSPGLPRASPGLPRTSPGLPRTSPGLPRTSPGLPRLSPGLIGSSPVASASSPVLPRASPGVPRTSPVITQSNVIIPSIDSTPPQNPQVMSNTSPIMLPSPTLAMSGSPVPTTNAALPRMTIGQPTTSPGTVRSRSSVSSTVTTVPITSPTTSSTSPLICRTSPVISRSSPAASRISPVITRAGSFAASKSGKPLATMSPDKLRTVFGISNSEVEVMPVSMGEKYPLPEPAPQTYLKVVDEYQHLPQESPLLLNAVKGLRRDSVIADVEVLGTHGPSHFRRSRVSLEDTRRGRQSQAQENENKQTSFSPSGLTDLQQSVRKQPPPLKPAASLVRRHSDSLDVHQINPIMHRLMYPSTHTNPAVSIHSTNSAPAEQQKMASLYSFAQPRCSPTQYPSAAQTGRRNSESSCTERSREYQQAVALSMQHQYQQHIGPSAPMMRSLGPDKATIFPIPAPMSTVVRPFKPPSPPASTRAGLEYQNENFYRSNMPFFERLRENIQQSCDTGIPTADRGGHASQKRLQSATGTVEKPLQPQTFAPRVLVRESIPETSPHMPPPSFSTPHFASTNQHLSSVIPNHHGHYPNNMHSSSAIHHINQTGIHPGNHQVASSVMANTNSSQRNNSGGSNAGEKKQCLNCPQPARFLCSGCKKAWYCSEQCQRDHWRIHNAACVL